MAKNKKLVSITLDIKLVEELKRYSERSLIPMSALISRLLESFLKIAEDESKMISFLENNEVDEASKEVLLFKYINKAIDKFHQ